MREIIKMVIVLTILSCFSGGLLAYINTATEDRIENQVLEFVKGPAVRSIFSEATNDPIADRIQIKDGEIERTFMPAQKRTVYWRQAAEQVKAQINVPLMLVGGIRSFETAEVLVDGGTADYISLCRPLVREPDLVRRWREGDRRAADCISDNACGWAGLKGGGVRCVHLES